MHRNDKLGFGKTLKPVFWGTAAVKTISIPFSLITAQLLSDVVTQAIQGKVDAVVMKSILILVLLLSSIALQTASNTAIRKKKTKALNQCRIDFLDSLFRNPLDRLFRADHGELTENLNNDMTASTKRFTELYPTILSSTLTAFGYLLFLIFKSPIAAASLLAISFLQLLPPVIVKKYMQSYYDANRKAEAAATDHILEGIRNFEIIKLYGLKSWWQSRLTGYYKKELVVGRKVDAVGTARRSMYRMLDNILKFGSYALMGIYMMLGYCPMDTAVQAIYLSSGLFEAVKSLFSTIPDIAVSEKAQERMGRWIPKDSRKGEAQVPDSESNTIALNGLSYSCENKDILHGLNYQFDVGQNYLIEGSNGAGKTTLFNLLTGLLLPKEGDVLVCGKPANQLGGDTLFKTLLYIPQNDPEYGFDAQTLFGMFGCKQQEALNQTAERLGLVEGRRNGCAIRDLSGGERKKVFLSIGFALHPKWLLLDEPSNNLDQYGREMLCGMLKERNGTIIISHDLIFREEIHDILKLKNGCIYREEK